MNDDVPNHYASTITLIASSMQKWFHDLQALLVFTHITSSLDLTVWPQPSDSGISFCYTAVNTLREFFRNLREKWLRCWKGFARIGHFQDFRTTCGSQRQRNYLPRSLESHFCKRLGQNWLQKHFPFGQNSACNSIYKCQSRKNVFTHESCQIRLEKSPELRYDWWLTLNLRRWLVTRWLESRYSYWHVVYR